MLVLGLISILILVSFDFYVSIDYSIDDRLESLFISQFFSKYR